MLVTLVTVLGNYFFLTAVVDLQSLLNYGTQLLLGRCQSHFSKNCTDPSVSIQILAEIGEPLPIYKDWLSQSWQFEASFIKTSPITSGEAEPPRVNPMTTDQTLLPVLVLHLATILALVVSQKKEDIALVDDYESDIENKLGNSLPLISLTKQPNRVVNKGLFITGPS